MKYNLAIKAEKSKAMSYFMTLANKKSLVEVKKLHPTRTLSQNSYLHLIIGAFGNHFGYTLEEAKIIYKQINAGIYVYEVEGKLPNMRTKFMRSSADLNKEEMAKSIDRFREQSAEWGCELPLATDQEWLRQISNEIEGSRYM